MSLGHWGAHGGLGEAVPGLWRCRGVKGSPVLHLSMLGYSMQWGISSAGLGECVGVCWYTLQMERRMLQEQGKKGGVRLPSSLLWVISLFEDVLGCQKPLHSWAASRL